MRLNSTLVSSIVEFVESTEMVGTSFTGLTVRVKLLESVPPITPSVTLTVMVAEPCLFAAGVMASVQLEELPETTSAPDGNRVELSELAVTALEQTMLWSTSVTLKVTG